MERRESKKDKELYNYIQNQIIKEIRTAKETAMRKDLLEQKYHSSNIHKKV